MENEFSNISQKLIMQSLEWAYAKAVNGVVGLGSAEELAQEYLKESAGRMRKRGLPVF